MRENLVNHQTNETESRKIHILVNRNQENLGAFNVIPIANAGFLLQSRRQLQIPDVDWFLFDFDDTLRGTTEAKGMRFDLYKDYVQRLGIDTHTHILEFIMSTTDVFSRWADAEASEDLYHANAHMSALDWSTKHLKTLSIKSLYGEDIDYEDAARNIAGHLGRIKTQLQDKQAIGEDTDPFYFKNSKLIFKSLIPWSKEIRDIFIQTMINPPDYSETIEAASYLGQPNGNLQVANIGIFTYGDAYYQLLKVFEFMQQNPNLFINQIWLARTPKGKFIEELAKTGFLQKMHVGNLESEKNERKHPRVIVIVDDSAKELNSILSSTEIFGKITETSFIAVRSRRNGTKEVEKAWVVRPPHGEIDFRNKTFTARDIATILQTNRRLSYDSRYNIDRA